MMETKQNLFLKHQEEPPWSFHVAPNKQTAADAKVHMLNLFPTLTFLMNKCTLWSLAPPLPVAHEAELTAASTHLTLHHSI